MAIAYSGNHRRVADVAVRALRVLLSILYVGLALLGLLVVSASALSPALITSAVGAVVFASLHRAGLERWPTWRRLLTAALCAGGFPPFLAGVNALGTAGGVLFVVIAALAVAAAVHWGYSQLPPSAET